MTSLSDLDAHAGGDGEKHPSFAFKRVKDGCKGRILRSDIVEVKQDNGTRTKLVIDLELTQESNNGIVNRDPDDTTIVTGYSSFPAGTVVTVWLPSGFGIGAVRDALSAAGAKALDNGGTLAVWLSEKRDTGKSMPANVYAAKYEPPVGGTSIDALGGEDPF